MPSDNLGKRLVRSLLVEQNQSKMSAAGIDRADIFDDARDAYDWALHFFQSSGTWPTAKQVEENTKVVLPEDQDDLEYISDLVRKRTLGKTLDIELKHVLRHLEGRDPDEALRTMRTVSSKLTSIKPGSGPISYRERGPERYESYKSKQDITGLLGLRTPWKKLDKAIGGWVDKTLTVLLAMQNTGKSWACCIIAEHTLSIGKNVLFVTMEMSTERMERRLDSIHYRIPFADLLQSGIDMFREERWGQEVIDEQTGRGDIHIADKQTIRYVTDVTDLVNDLKPDLVVIDGGYRFSARQSRDDWESSKQIVADLQTAAELTGKPWVVTSQQGEVPQKSKMEGAERAFKVKYAKEWVINPDNVIEMYQNDDLRLQEAMEWRLLKIRDDPGEGSRDLFRTNWNTKTVDFSEIEFESIVEGPSTTVTY